MKFGIKSLFVATFLAACLVVAYQSNWLFAVAVVIAINLIGVVAGLVVTKLLHFPTDGGYRNPIIRAEFDQDEIPDGKPVHLGPRKQKSHS